MVLVKSGPDIDEAPAKRGYFLPYQVEWIEQDARMAFAEKSVRIGWTYADAFKNVRKRLWNTNRDYLFATKDWPTALEYIQTCKKFVEVYNRVKSIVSQGEMTIKVPSIDDQGRKTGFDEEVKIGYIKFDNGSRILAFTSNPAAMQAYGGDVGLDEFAKHKQQQALYGTAQGRITWGFDMGIWSAHWGDGTLFWDLARDARVGKGPFDYVVKVTMEDAIEQGLVEKINEVSGSTDTREKFLADCKKRAILPEIYDQEYMCEPVGGTATIVPWEAIARCMADYTDYERVHFEATEIKETFGEFSESTELIRKARIHQFLSTQFIAARNRQAHHQLGFDVAASGVGDLASIYVDEKQGDGLIMRALFSCRTDDWNFLKIVAIWFMNNLTAVQGRGDETGLGRQICWELKNKFQGRFEGVNFASDKHAMGFALMNQLAEARKKFPRAEADQDIASDFYALRKTFGTSKKWIFSESKNPRNPNSHCDIAWAGGLSTWVGQELQPQFGAIELE